MSLTHERCGCSVDLSSPRLDSSGLLHLYCENHDPDNRPKRKKSRVTASEVTPLTYGICGCSVDLSSPRLDSSGLLHQYCASHDPHSQPQQDNSRSAMGHAPFTAITRNDLPNMFHIEEEFIRAVPSKPVNSIELRTTGKRPVKDSSIQPSTYIVFGQGPVKDVYGVKPTKTAEPRTDGNSLGCANSKPPPVSINLPPSVSPAAIVNSVKPIKTVEPLMGGSVTIMPLVSVHGWSFDNTTDLVKSSKETVQSAKPTVSPEYFPTGFSYAEPRSNFSLVKSIGILGVAVLTIAIIYFMGIRLVSCGQHLVVSVKNLFSTKVSAPFSQNIVFVKSAVNMRSGPGKKYSVIKPLSKGTKLKLVDKNFSKANRGWCLVSTDDSLSGYIDCRFIANDVKR